MLYTILRTLLNQGTVLWINELKKALKNLTQNSSSLSGIQCQYLQNTKQLCYCSIIAERTIFMGCMYVFHTLLKLNTPTKLNLWSKWKCQRIRWPIPSGCSKLSVMKCKCTHVFWLYNATAFKSIMCQIVCKTKQMWTNKA